jgi:nitrite reductase/ring-hydroxylating ferredoxin subunit
MGNLMRQYWIPAMLSKELPAPDSAPLRVRILNENLIAFRVTSGKVGLIDDYCPHRGASMFFGRNAEDGLRCIYHGWKFDVTGRCTDMMTEPPESKLKDKVRATAYPTQERNGIVWVYMGPLAEPPPLPEFEANMVPQQQAKLFVTLGNYNWHRRSKTIWTRPSTPFSIMERSGPNMQQNWAQHISRGRTCSVGWCRIVRRASISARRIMAQFRRPIGQLTTAKPTGAR